MPPQNQFHKNTCNICVVLALSGLLTAPQISWADKSTDAISTSSTLSTDPQTEVIIPPGRPTWVEATPVRGKQGDETAVSSEPFATTAACEAALDKKILQTVQEYIEERTHSKLASQLIRYDLTEIKDRLVPSSNYYEETIVSPSVGPMQQIHARIQFPASFAKEVDHRWLQVRSAARVGQIGIGFVALLGIFSTIAGFFRADNATRGYYTGRLQFLAVGAILGMMVLGAMVAQWIPWI